MRIIESENITSAVKQLFIDCNFVPSDDICAGLNHALQISTSPAEKYAISTILENHRIAKEESIPLCQDTGMAVLFVKYGDNVCCDGFSKALEEGVMLAYKDGYLRKSVVDDPVFDRNNTGDNLPCIVHTEIVSGDKIEIHAMAKGFGSENMSALKMFQPSSSIGDIEDFVCSTVEKAGANPCPPIIVGVGIGGTFEKAALLAKEATLRPLGTKNEDERYAKAEENILNRINAMHIGCAGFGGDTTALGVNIEYFPTHIAGLPVAVNICCHASRHSKVII